MRTFVLATAMLALAASTGNAAQSKTDGLRDTVDDTIAIQRETQEKQDDWTTERRELESSYRSAKANVDYLLKRKTVKSEEATALAEAVADLEHSLDESARLHSSLQDTLNTALLNLEDWLDRDLPFQMDERKLRVDLVRKELAKSEVSGAEKLRRLLEVLQIEAEYGSTVEVYQDQIETAAGEALFVDILRLGRISVFWRTPDGARVGELDPGTGKWVDLPDKHNRVISRAMDMATRIRPVELIALPLGRIQP